MFCIDKRSSIIRKWGFIVTLFIVFAFCMIAAGDIAFLLF